MLLHMFHITHIKVSSLPLSMFQVSCYCLNYPIFRPHLPLRTAHGKLVARIEKVGQGQALSQCQAAVLVSAVLVIAWNCETVSRRPVIVVKFLKTNIPHRVGIELPKF